MYNERIKVESLTQAICDLALQFGESNEDSSNKKVMVFIRLILLEQAFWSCFTDWWN